jgi:hypothetical protein
VTVPISCTGAMVGEATLTVSSSVAKWLGTSRRTLAAEDAQCYGAHSLSVRLKPSRALARKLARHGGPRTIALRLSVQMHDFGRAPQKLHKTITLKR